MTGTKQDAFDLFEVHRAEWLMEARAEAEAIGRETGTCTADQIHKVCPIPDGIDGRVMGAVFLKRDWKPGAFVLSARKACHKRPIRVFHWKG